MAWFVAVSSASSAQTPPARLRAEGDETGIAVTEDGRSRLHLGLNAGLGFDTNPYTTPLATGDFNGDASARIRPYIEATLPGAQWNLRGRAAFDYGFLPGAVNRQTRASLLYQASGGVDVEWNRGSAWNFAVGDTVSINTDPGVIALGSLLSRVNNQVRAGVGFTPGGGSLSFRLGLISTLVHYFEDPNNDSFVLSDGLLDSLNNSLTLRADYRFLPKTGLFAVVNAGWQTYPFAQRSMPQAFPLGGRLGIQGQFLSKLSGLASIGYENPFVFNTNGLQSGSVVGFVGQGELQWNPGPASALAAGYRRGFDPVALYQYLGQNKFYVRGSQLIGVTELSGNLSWNVLEYGAEDTGDEACLRNDLEQCNQLTDKVIGRIDNAIAVNVRAFYYVLPWLALGVSNGLDWRLTNANTIAVPGVPGVNLSYLRNETLVLASARY